MLSRDLENVHELDQNDAIWLMFCMQKNSSDHEMQGNDAIHEDRNKSTSNNIHLYLFLQSNLSKYKHLTNIHKKYIYEHE